MSASDIPAREALAACLVISVILFGCGIIVAQGNDHSQDWNRTTDHPGDICELSQQSRSFFVVMVVAVANIAMTVEESSRFLCNAEHPATSPMPANSSTVTGISVERSFISLDIAASSSFCQIGSFATPVIADSKSMDASAVAAKSRKFPAELLQSG